MKIELTKNEINEFANTNNRVLNLITLVAPKFTEEMVMTSMISNLNNSPIKGLSATLTPTGIMVEIEQELLMDIIRIYGDMFIGIYKLMYENTEVKSFVTKWKKDK